MPHLPAWDGNLGRLLARIWRDNQRGILYPRHRRSNVRLRHQDGVVENRRDLQVGADAAPSRTAEREGATHYAGAPDVPCLEMSGQRHEDLPFPLPGRKSTPRMQYVGGWMRPAIHP